MRVLILGAGASGLVTAKVLAERGHQVSIVDASARLGGTFENKAYKEARMVSSKHLTLFSDCRRPNAEMHMTLVDYVAYLEEYAGDFNLNKLIRFATKVLNVEKNAKGMYTVTLEGCGDEHPGSQPYTEEYEAVAVCSGLHNQANIPKFPGQDEFEGKILHSSTYKDPEMFKDQRVLVIGTGETAFDVGYAAASHGAKEVTMSTRHGFVSVPAFFGGDKPPLDCVIMNFATHAWESKWAQRVGLHWWITTKFTRMGFLLTTGCSYGFNQWVGKRFNMTWDEGRKHIVNKSARCMPLLTRKAKRQAPWLLRQIWSIWDEAADHIPVDIDLVEGSVKDLKGKTVRYDTRDGGVREVEADVVVLATGYKQKFPFLKNTAADEKMDDPLPTKHFMINPEDPRMAYIGFIRPNVGAIPPMSELQAMWWAEKLEDKVVEDNSNLDTECYKLTGSRLKYGVDYGYYMFALAREINAVPSLMHWLFRSPKVFLACCFGQAHVPIFRLQGPFASKDCEETVRGELFNVICKRPFVMNFTFAIEALGFGIINAIAYLIENHGKYVAAAGIGLGAMVVRKNSFKAMVA